MISQWKFQIRHPLFFFVCMYEVIYLLQKITLVYMVIWSIWRRCHTHHHHHRTLSTLLICTQLFFLRSLIVIFRTKPPHARALTRNSNQFLLSIHRLSVVHDGDDENAGKLISLMCTLFFFYKFKCVKKHNESLQKKKKNWKDNSPALRLKFSRCACLLSRHQYSLN